MPDTAASRRRRRRPDTLVTPQSLLQPCVVARSLDIESEEYTFISELPSPTLIASGLRWIRKMQHTAVLSVLYLD